MDELQKRITRINRGHQYFARYWSKRQAKQTQYKLYLIKILIVSMNCYFELLNVEFKSDEQARKFPHLCYLFHLLMELNPVRFYSLPLVHPSHKYRQLRNAMISDFNFFRRFDTWPKLSDRPTYEPEFRILYSLLIDGLNSCH